MKFGERVYKEGFTGADFRRGVLRNETVIVSPIRPPANLGGLALPDTLRDLPGTACLMYRVEASPSGCPFDEGDIVVLATEYLVPLEPSLNKLAIEEQHIICALSQDPENEDEPSEEVAG